LSELVFYNTRTSGKQPFVPIEPGRVLIYSCGPTVYAPQHLGNLRPYVFADLLRRTLEEEGFEVTHVINVTDVGHLQSDADDGEDKMEVAASSSGSSAQELAAKYTEQWLRDRYALNCRDPEVLCRATEHIAEQIELARELEDRGYTYRIPDGIYFDVSKFPRYAEFAGLDLSGQLDGQRIDPIEGKRHPADFAIWKFAAPGVVRQQEWDSPWGRGFPGWHLECSAMSMKYLGDHFDIHTGGIDHVRVHHTNEIAQSECATGVEPWVNLWMHNEFISFEGEKMAKSTGNVALLDDLIARGVEPLAYRYFLLQAHYRQQQTYTEEAIDAAAVGYRRLLGLAAEVRDAPSEEAEEPEPPGARSEGPDGYRQRFRDAMRDDLNAPKALAVAWEVARGRQQLSPCERRELLLEFDRILGLDLVVADSAQPAFESDPRIDAQVADRQRARAARDWEAADRIRDELAEQGIEIVDSPEGPRWRRT
jgi:cysteinyl-tRNA synthetase